MVAAHRNRCNSCLLTEARNEKCRTLYSFRSKTRTSKRLCRPALFLDLGSSQRSFYRSGQLHYGDRGRGCDGLGWCAFLGRAPGGALRAQQESKAFGMASKGDSGQKFVYRILNEAVSWFCSVCFCGAALPMRCGVIIRIHFAAIFFPPLFWGKRKNIQLPPSSGSIACEADPSSTLFCTCGHLVRICPTPPGVCSRVPLRTQKTTSFGNNETN